MEETALQTINENRWFAQTESELDRLKELSEELMMIVTKIYIVN